MPGWLRAQGSQVMLALATGTSYLICECYYCYCLEVRKSATGLIFLIDIWLQGRWSKAAESGSNPSSHQQLAEYS